MAPSSAPSTQAGVLDDPQRQIGSGSMMRIAEEQNGRGGIVDDDHTHNLQTVERGGEDGGSRQRFIEKGHWKPSEDVKLRELVALHGPKNWNIISKQLPGRSGKSCRLRWVNQLNPRIKKTAFSKEEDVILTAAHDLFGNQWSHIARFFPGRTDNAIKNHWHVLNARRQRNLPGPSSSAAFIHRPPSGNSTNGSTGSTVTLLGKSAVISEGTSPPCTNSPRPVFRDEEIKRALAVADGCGYLNRATDMGGGYMAEAAGSSMPSTAPACLIHPSSPAAHSKYSNPSTATSHFTPATAPFSPSSPPPSPLFIDFLGVGG